MCVTRPKTVSFVRLPADLRKKGTVEGPRCGRDAVNTDHPAAHHRGHSEHKDPLTCGFSPPTYMCSRGQLKFPQNCQICQFPPTALSELGLSSPCHARSLAARGLPVSQKPSVLATRKRFDVSPGSTASIVPSSPTTPRTTRVSSPRSWSSANSACLCSVVNPASPVPPCPYVQVDFSHQGSNLNRLPLAHHGLPLFRDACHVPTELTLFAIRHLVCDAPQGYAWLKPRRINSAVHDGPSS